MWNPKGFIFRNLFVKEIFRQIFYQKFCCLFFLFSIFSFSLFFFFWHFLFPLNFEGEKTSVVPFFSFLFFLLCSWLRFSPNLRRIINNITVTELTFFFLHFFFFFFFCCIYKNKRKKFLKEHFFLFLFSNSFFFLLQKAANIFRSWDMWRSAKNHLLKIFFWKGKL